jgi:ribosomal protein S18 acetylase RimI-like enzyme/predicted nucleic acid-binding protein
MKISERPFEVLWHYTDVAEFVAQVVSAADQNKNSLGFLPSSVFDEYARKEQLLVIVERVGGASTYAGHVLFDSRHPKAHILQMFVVPSFRRSGLAAQLLDRLKTQLTEHDYISVYARVAEDLGDANAFWQRQGFYVQRVAPGGKARKRTILVRTHELDSPQLFAPSGLSNADPLGLHTTPISEIPIFLLDLNVLFDLNPRRARREEAIDLFRAERQRSCQLAISTEFAAELERTAKPGLATDPMQAYAQIFATFATPEEDVWAALAAELTPLVFSDKHANSSLNANDISDLRHLATAIHRGLSGLITNDNAILNAASSVRQRYGIQILSPAAFRETSALEESGEAFETTSASTLSLNPMLAKDEAAIRDLLSELGLSGATQIADWAITDAADRIFYRRVVWCGGVLLGYLLWPKKNLGGVIVARLAIDESQPNAVNATRALLRELIEHESADALQLRLEFPAHQVYVREVASALGFRGVVGQASLTKIALNRIVTEKNWIACRETLLSLGRIGLPNAPPTYRSIDQQLQLSRPDGNRVHLPLSTLEALLSPAIFCLPGRPAVITPVRREFAEHLLGHVPQKSLLPRARASLYQSRHYFSGARTLKQFKRGGLMLFYESAKHGGLGAIVAIARIEHAYLKSKEAIDSSDLDASVLDAASLEAIGKSEKKTVTVFTNVVRFRRPVPLATLRQLNCGKSTELITTRSINDTQFQSILAYGFRND